MVVRQGVCWAWSDTPGNENSDNCQIGELIAEPDGRYRVGPFLVTLDPWVGGCGDLE